MKYLPSTKFLFSSRRRALDCVSQYIPNDTCTRNSPAQLLNLEAIIKTSAKYIGYSSFHQRYHNAISNASKLSRNTSFKGPSFPSTAKVGAADSASKGEPPPGPESSFEFELELSLPVVSEATLVVVSVVVVLTVVCVSVEIEVVDQTSWFEVVEEGRVSVMVSVDDGDGTSSVSVV